MSYYRRIWEKHHGPIPDGHVLHHINGDRFDNSIENLQLMTASAHYALHSQQRQGRTGRELHKTAKSDVFVMYANDARRELLERAMTKSGTSASETIELALRTYLAHGRSPAADKRRKGEQ